MAPCFFIYIFLFFIQQEKRSFPFTVYPCRVCEQTNGKRKKNEEINSENVYKKKGKKRTKRHEHTYTLNATQNRETDRKKNRRCRLN